MFKTDPCAKFNVQNPSVDVQNQCVNVSFSETLVYSIRLKFSFIDS